MKITNHYGLPQAIVESITSDRWYNKGESDISVTELIAPPQIRHLLKKHGGQGDAADRIWLLLGSAVHEILQKARLDDDYIVEKRYYKDIPTDDITNGRVKSVKIGGQIDLIHKPERLLQDYKVVGTYSIQDGIKPEWEIQTNIYRHLVTDTPIDKIQIVTILRDWKSGLTSDPDYPQTPVQILNVNVWEPEKVESYIKNRLVLHLGMELGDMDIPCSKNERWYSEGKLAVIRKGAKRAKRLFGEGEIEAAMELKKKMGDKYIIQKRKGKSIRCNPMYCTVAHVCPQRKENNQ